MTARDDLNRRLSTWMTETAAAPPPAGRFDRVMAATARRRPRPRWLAALGSHWVGTAAHPRLEPAWPTPRRELVLAATVALLVAALVGFQAIVGPSGRGLVGLPSPTCTSNVHDWCAAWTAPPPTAGPTATPPAFDGLLGELRDGPLEAGTYEFLDVAGKGFNVRFTVPPGWAWNGAYLSKGGITLPDGAAIFFVSGPVQVYTDPCLWVGAAPNPPTGPTVVDLMAGLASQPMRGTATPIERLANSLGAANRWPGLSLELTVPADVNLAGCGSGRFRRWSAGALAETDQGPGQRDLVWAVELRGDGVHLEGERLIIDAASFPATPPDVLAELEAILASIAAGHWG